MDSLIPREKSIVDVLTLDKLGADNSDTLLVRPRQADRKTTPDARLPRSLVCALTAELSVAIDEKPWDFFDHTDLLDFPGARSRLKLASLEDVAKAKGVAEGANPLRELLLRGKVAYLFQRYSAERELERHPALHSRRQPGSARPLRHDDGVDRPDDRGDAGGPRQAEERAVPGADQDGP